MWKARAKRLIYAAGIGFGGYYGYKAYTNFNDRVVSAWGAQYANVPVPTRAEHKQRIKSGEEFDILVIGGGATGSGIALDAATRGLKVALVERDDFASGTSSRSTKLLHGGIRYLEKAAKHLDYGEFKLVMEALHERTRVLKNAPHLAHPLPLVLPVRSWLELPQYWIGLKMYDTIAGASGMFKSFYLSKEQTVTVFPTINPNILTCSVVYYDGQMNDARLNVSIALTAAAHGATVVNHTEVLSLLKKSNPHRGGSEFRANSQLPHENTHSEITTTTSGAPVFHPEPTTPASLPAPVSVSPPEHVSASLQESVSVSPPSEPITPIPLPSLPVFLPTEPAPRPAEPEPVHIATRDNEPPRISTREISTDSGVSASDPTSSVSTSTPSIPSLVHPLPPPSPSPPPISSTPDTPIDKTIESIKSLFTGSSKNLVQEPYLLADHVVSGVVVRDSLTGEEYEIKAKCVINATGPFADGIRRMDDITARPLVAASAGSHIILPNYYCPPNIGFVDAKSPDGRVIFLLPFENHTLVGTTDYPCELTATPKPPESDITFILEQVRTYLNPDIKVKRSDVLAAWTGIRPLALDHSSINTAQISRNHVIHVDDSGLISIVGGKWTTYRRMAEETVDKAVAVVPLRPPHRSHTEKLPLWGAHKYKPTLNITLMQNYGFEPDIAQHLAHNYGDKAFIVAELAHKGYGRRLVEELPFLEAEIVYSVNEYAQTTVDVIARRTRLAFLDNEATKAAIPKVVDLLASQLQWDEARKQKETLAAYTFLETMK